MEETENLGQQEVSEIPQEPVQPEPEVTSEAVEVEEEAPIERPNKRLPAKTRINQITREKFAAQHEAQLLREENERLRKLAEINESAALGNYDHAIQLRIDQAKRDLTKAIEEGDVSLQADSIDKIAEAKAEAKQLEAWKANQKYAAERSQSQSQQQQQPQEYYQPQVNMNEETESWLSQNQWFVPDSPEFDSDMAQEVQAYAAALDRKLNRQGQQNKILSKEYFDHINDYVRREFYDEEPEQPQRNLNMKPQKHSPAPVMRSAPQAKAAKPRIVLSEDEKFMARNMGITEEAWIKAKIQDQQLQQQRGR